MVRTGECNTAGYLIKDKFGRPTADKFAKWTSTWNLLDPYIIKKMFHPVGVVDENDVGVETREKPEPEMKKKKFGTVSKKIKKIGRVGIRLSISSKPHENDCDIDPTNPKKKIPHPNIYSTDYADEDEEEPRNGIISLQGMFLCVYIIKHKSGYIYFEYYPETSAGLLKSDSGSLKYKYMWKLGHIWDLKRPSDHQYSLINTIVAASGKQSTSGSKPTYTKTVSGVEWNKIHIEYFTVKSYKAKIMQTIETNSAVNCPQE